MAKYRKKPVVIEAVQFIEIEFIRGNPKFRGIPIQDRAHLSELWFGKGVEDGRFYINTLEGDMTISEGDFIIKGVDGGFYPCKPDIFEKTYEVVE